MTDSLLPFFFEAMLLGWAAGGKKKTIPAFPNHKVVEHIDDNLRLLDMWSETPSSNKSSGSTTIFLDDIPVWAMHYGGWYTEEAAEIVKAALREAYEKNQFFGGRGPIEFVHNGIFYANRPQGDFNNFSGREELRRIDHSEILGFHEYWGISLL